MGFKSFKECLDFVVSSMYQFDMDLGSSRKEFDISWCNPQSVSSKEFNERITRPFLLEIDPLEEDFQALATKRTQLIPIVHQRDYGQVPLLQPRPNVATLIPVSIPFVAVIQEYLKNPLPVPNYFNCLDLYVKSNSHYVADMEKVLLPPYLDSKASYHDVVINIWLLESNLFKGISNQKVVEAGNLNLRLKAFMALDKFATTSDLTTTGNVRLDSANILNKLRETVPYGYFKNEKEKQSRIKNFWQNAKRGKVIWSVLQALPPIPIKIVQKLNWQSIQGYGIKQQEFLLKMIEQVVHQRE